LTELNLFTKRVVYKVTRIIGIPLPPKAKTPGNVNESIRVVKKCIVVGHAVHATLKVEVVGVE